MNDGHYLIWLHQSQLSILATTPAWTDIDILDNLIDSSVFFTTDLGKHG
ncbi:MAG: hypothetical protein IV298_04675 [Cylindrospermopsis raciborskii KL1]|jgi:hypothetical protein|nr:hypothetical protein [Cylindrospermopsis raciborskii]MBG0742771.1 hypothetical protein [Cylindrospermopsis raciborskii KL1]